MNASSAQQDMRLEPPRDTKGKVTPVKGRRSMVPKTFSASWAIIMVTAPQAAMTK